MIQVSTSLYYALVRIFRLCDVPDERLLQLSHDHKQAFMLKRSLTNRLRVVTSQGSRLWRIPRLAGLLFP